MAYLTMKQLLEAGVHFGHQTTRWNPKMKPYIFGARNGIYIIDLQQTVKMFRDAYDFIKNATARGEKILFVGTKKQAQDIIKEEAHRCGMLYIHQRWVGGLLTNFSTIKNNIKRLKELEALTTEGQQGLHTKKELLKLDRERQKLENYLVGIKEMNGLPNVLFVVDSKKETIAIKEAKKLGIPVVAVVDTNCDPSNVDLVIPGNDDAIRAIKLFISAVADACVEGRQLYEESLQAVTDKEEGENLTAVSSGSESAVSVQEAAE